LLPAQLPRRRRIRPGAGEASRSPTFDVSYGKLVESIATTDAGAQRTRMGHSALVNV